MTVRPVLAIGNLDLRKVTAPVDPHEIANVRVQLVDDLIDTMHATDGAGLAATQIGEHVRVVLLEVEDNPRYPYRPEIPLTVATSGTWREAFVKRVTNFLERVGS